MIGTHPDDRTYAWAAQALRAGMFASMAAMIGGLLWWLASGAPGGEAAATKTVPIDQILPQVSAGNPLAVLNMGVLLLLATPALTLLVQLVTFTMARNWRYAGITAFIFCILLLSMAISLGWLHLF